MAKLIAKVGVYGDIHLCSKNYGAHRDYANESLGYFHKITEITKENGLTHLIGTGDFSFGRFHSLEYRLAVELELQEQMKLTSGNRYELRGNHDEAGYGLTERDFYVKSGLLKAATGFDIGKVHFSLVDFGHADDKLNIHQGETNIAVAHDFYRFKNTQTPFYGDAIFLDEKENWFGVDYLVCGHVHSQLVFEGNVKSSGNEHKMLVHYPGCATRPAYSESLNPEVGQVAIISIFDDGSVDYGIAEFDLLPVNEAFNVEGINEVKELKLEKENRVDISDIVYQLDTHDKDIGSPETIIESLEGVDPRFKDKALELLKEAMA